ncbi:MAG TPA: LLM class flavin-dependent oxidoreductase [Methylomirabilota bacterium]|nr:LLM class flavin-dependent oxidoreductase [Methylomirabilota bacterium]
MTRAKRRPLKIGVELPIAVDKGRHGTPRWSDVSRMARRAEEVGFDSVWIEDHLLFRPDGRGSQGVWEGWALIAAVAAVTSRVEIGPLVSCMSFRNPAHLAKLADTIDEISGGRLILGVGAGWHEAEYRAFGFPFDHRVSRFEEGLGIVHALLRHGKVDFVGHYHEARECELQPRGPRPGGPPILIGSIGARMLRLAAHYADLWNAYFTHTKNHPDGVGPLRDRVDTACREAGRDPATLGRTAAVFVDIAPGRRASPPLPPHWAFAPLAGSPERLADELRSYAREGIGHVQLWLEPNTLESLETFAAVLDLLDR